MELGEETNLRTSILTLFVIAIIGLSAQAQAARHYYLVGLRHVYKIPVYPDPHELDRQTIEETYSAAVIKAQNQYDADMNSIADEEAKDNGTVHQSDRDAVQLNIEQDTADAADARDSSLGLIYVLDDNARVKHPELTVEQDGPYRVMAIDTNASHVFVDVCFFNPYPLCVEVCPFGWGYGRIYPFATLGIAVRGWHATWLSLGCPIFAGICFGGHPIEIYMPLRRSVIMNRDKWVGGRPPAITAQQRENLTRNRGIQAQRGITHEPAHTGSAGSRSKYSRVGTPRPTRSTGGSGGRSGGDSRSGGGGRSSGGDRSGGGGGGGGRSGGGGGGGGGKGKGH